MSSEKNLEIRLREKIKALGGRAIKFTSPGSAGVPDRLVLIDGRAEFVELKTFGGNVSPLQQDWQDEFKRMGQYAIVIRGNEDLDAYFRRLDDLRRETVSAAMHEEDN